MIPSRAVGTARVCSSRGFGTLDLRPSATKRYIPRQMQVEAIHWLRKMRSALLADEMGLGKTSTILRALPPRPRAFIAAPTSVLLQWEDEIPEWRPDLRMTVDEPMHRPNEGEILLISKDSLPEHWNEPLRDCYAICDEAQWAKNGRALCTQRWRQLAWQSGWVWALTGSPMTDYPDDLWGVLVSARLTWLFADPDTQSTGRTPIEYFVHLCGGREKWMFDKKTRMKRRIGYEWGQVSPEVNEILRKGMLRRLSDDYLDLPPYREVIVPVAAPKELPLLDEAKRRWDELGLGPRDLPPFELVSSAKAALARDRIPAVVEYVGAAAEGQRLLVFSDYLDPVYAVAELPGATCITGEEGKADRKKALAEFRSGKKRILAMTIASGGVGLHLPEATMVVFADLNYSAELNLQALKRAHRSGQTKSILVAYFVSRHPLEVRLSEIVREKSRLKSAVIDGAPNE